uniref:Uncharacterized protein LOC105042926 n=1 Tax=Elaeis guineensis var. tenera TaxID=51953 RepID=A0A6I9R169_ELAGV|nr:uncharacterized protein LOC105042926 [Elaeis guineensis]
MARELFSRRGPHLAGSRLPSDSTHRPAMDRRHRAHAAARKGSTCRPSRVVIIGGLGLAVIVFFALGFWQQSTMIDGPVDDGPRRRPLGSVLRFVPADLQRRFEEQGGLDRLRSEREPGIRRPRVALVIGSMDKDSRSLMLLTLVKYLTELGYKFTIFALKHGEAHSLWTFSGYEVSFVSTKQDSKLEYGSVDWSNFEGVILSSLEGKQVISSLMQEPFVSVPLIWLIQEDILGKHISHYTEWGWQDLISEWRSAFSRADVVVFPDYSLPLLYSLLDIGNFFVISGSPVDVWATQGYIKSHSRYELRKKYGFGEDDLLILVTGSHLFYDELPWDYVAAMHALAPQVKTHARLKDLGGMIKFVFLCGNSTDASGSFQEIATHLGFPEGSVRQYGMDHDVNNLLLMADSVLYGSFEEEQSFPPLLLRAMSFGIPIVAPDLTTIKKYVVDQTHGFIFHPSDPESLATAFSHLIKDKKLSSLAHVAASNARELSMDMQASDCIAGYAKLLENVLQFPSDVMLPQSFSPTRQTSWLWGLFVGDVEERDYHMQTEGYLSRQRSSIVYLLEEQYAKNHMDNRSRVEKKAYTEEFPTQLDWDIVSEMEISEDLERREIQELEERMERTLGSWEDVYRNAKKAEKLKFEANERDEGELERTGRPLCIYEIYNGEGAWPFLHRGSIYRGITLLRSAQRSRADDLDAVSRLPILNETYYRDILCELGAMFAVANGVDNVHKLPWIGFQSWRAAGKKVSLSDKAAEILEKTIQSENKGDVVYYWALMAMDPRDVETEDTDFWSMCDSLNNGHCRAVFEDAFRRMYGLPDDVEALPPMPVTGGQWSVLHSWVMPTPSFLEFVMFSRMFADSLDSLNKNNSSTTECVLGSSMLEKRHCYCRIFEVLVNVWAYHSARRMVYLNPSNGNLSEQHPLERRDMWVKYFSFPLLKSMDEDLAEEADDGMHPADKWLWPSTGEVLWQGILDREREQRYRRKMDKKRKTKEKLLERQKYGYKQKTLGQEQKDKV